MSNGNRIGIDLCMVSTWAVYRRHGRYCGFLKVSGPVASGAAYDGIRARKISHDSLEVADVEPR
jgi:hypothetical protein